MKIYCVKCRNKTDTKNEKKVVLPNGRSAMQGLCGCGCKKTVFVSNKKGGMYNQDNKNEFNEPIQKPKRKKNKA